MGLGKGDDLFRKPEPDTSALRIDRRSSFFLRIRKFDDYMLFVLVSDSVFMAGKFLRTDKAAV